MDGKQATYFVIGIIAITLLCFVVIFPAIEKKRRSTESVDGEKANVHQEVTSEKNKGSQDITSPYVITTTDTVSSIKLPKAKVR